MKSLGNVGGIPLRVWCFVNDLRARLGHQHLYVYFLLFFFFYPHKPRGHFWVTGEIFQRNSEVRKININWPLKMWWLWPYRWVWAEQAWFMKKIMRDWAALILSQWDSWTSWAEEEGSKVSWSPRMVLSSSVCRCMLRVGAIFGG